MCAFYTVLILVKQKLQSCVLFTISDISITVYDFVLKVGCHVGACRANASFKTQIHFVTNAVLLNEYQKDSMLTNYAVVIIDEAHERHVDTDLLFGAMKLCLNRRSDIKVSYILESSRCPTLF